MLAWITANLSTILIGAVLAVIVAAIVRHLYRDKKRGISPCGGSCGACGACGRGCGGCASRAQPPAEDGRRQHGR